MVFIIVGFAIPLLYQLYLIPGYATVGTYNSKNYARSSYMTRRRNHQADYVEYRRALRCSANYCWKQLLHI